MPRLKTIGLRPTEEEKAILDTYVSEHSEIKKPSQALKDIAFKQYPDLLNKLKTLEAQKTLIPPLKPKDASILPFSFLTETKISPMIKNEVARFMRGKDSVFIEAMLNMTKESLERSEILATKRGIVLMIPTHNS